MITVNYHTFCYLNANFDIITFHMCAFVIEFKDHKSFVLGNYKFLLEMI